MSQGKVRNIGVGGGSKLGWPAVPVGPEMRCFAGCGKVVGRLGRLAILQQDEQRGWKDGLMLCNNRNKGKNSFMKAYTPFV